jgi:hypothetical protein
MVYLHMFMVEVPDRTYRGRAPASTIKNIGLQHVLVEIYHTPNWMVRFSKPGFVMSCVWLGPPKVDLNDFLEERCRSLRSGHREYQAERLDNLYHPVVWVVA